MKDSRDIKITETISITYAALGDNKIGLSLFCVTFIKHYLLK